MKHYLISYTLSDKKTFDLKACFLDQDYIIPDDIGVYIYLKELYPMFNVYIENLVVLEEIALA